MVADGAPVRHVSTMVPLPADPVQAATLVCNGQVKARTQITEFVSAASEPQARLEGGSLILEWNTSGTPVLVQNRRSDESDWNTLGVDLTEGLLSIDADALPGGIVRFRVVGTGGADVLVASASTEREIELPDKPPRVWITGPTTVRDASSVVLFGHGYDAEDGVLDDLIWTVNGEPAGRGKQLELLGPRAGTLVVALSGTDSTGHTIAVRHELFVESN
jgi:hypothetical protein